MGLTANELELLRLIRGNANGIYHFDIRCVPTDSLNAEFKALKDNGFVAKRSGAVYQITSKGLAALRQAVLADDALNQAAKDETRKRAAESRKKPLVILAKLALWLGGAIVAALISHFVPLLFQ